MVGVPGRMEGGIYRERYHPPYLPGCIYRVPTHHTLVYTMRLVVHPPWENRHHSAQQALPPWGTGTTLRNIPSPTMGNRHHSAHKPPSHHGEQAPLCAYTTYPPWGTGTTLRTVLPTHHGEQAPLCAQCTLPTMGNRHHSAQRTSLLR